MLMRERSGRSGRRRGSQKLGTAMESKVFAGGADGAGDGPLLVCAGAAVAANTVSVTATAKIRAPRQREPKNGIHLSFIENGGDHSIAVAAGQSELQCLISFPSSIPGQMLFDLMHRHFDKILIHLGANRTLQCVRIGWTAQRKRARGSHHDQRFGFPGRDCDVKMLNQLCEKGPFRLIVPVGLVDCTSHVADGIDSAAGRVCSQFVRREVLLFEDLDCLQIGEFDIAGILQNQGLGAVTHDDPFSMSDQECGHGLLLKVQQDKSEARLEPYSGSNVVEPVLCRTQYSFQLVPSSRRRAITCAWISAAPSKMLRIRASHRMRETGNSSANPLPPCTCTALSAAAHAILAASNLAMPASRSQRRPESFSRAA